MRTFESIRTVCAACSLLVALLSCGLGRHPIPAGVYANPSGDETISAGDSQLQFRISTDPGHPETFVDRTYGYKVFKYGQLVPGPMSSGEAALGVGRYRWTWDGKDIIRYDRRTGETVKFTRRPPQ